MITLISIIKKAGKKSAINGTTDHHP